MSSGGKRGTGSCDNCQQVYSCRNKPKHCTNCKFFIGGSYAPQPKKKKCVILAAVKLSENIFSVATTNRNDRCFVSHDENGAWICLHESCKERRAMLCNSGIVEQFRCEHTDKASDFPQEPLTRFNTTEEGLVLYACSSSIRGDPDKFRGSCQVYHHTCGTSRGKKFRGIRKNDCK